MYINVIMCRICLFTSGNFHPHVEKKSQSYEFVCISHMKILIWHMWNFMFSTRKTGNAGTHPSFSDSGEQFLPDLTLKPLLGLGSDKSVSSLLLDLLL